MPRTCNISWSYKFRIVRCFSAVNSCFHLSIHNIPVYLHGGPHGPGPRSKCPYHQSPITNHARRSTEVFGRAACRFPKKASRFSGHYRYVLNSFTLQKKSNNTGYHRTPVRCPAYTTSSLVNRMMDHLADPRSKSERERLLIASLILNDVQPRPLLPPPAPEDASC
jgi:hypothetical protein